MSRLTFHRKSDLQSYNFMYEQPLRRDQSMLQKTLLDVALLSKALKR